MMFRVPQLPQLLPLLLLVPLLGAPLAGCTYFGGDPHVMVTSTPPGATVLIDGEETGDTTPAKLDLGGLIAGDHSITLRKRGYQDETREVMHYTTYYTSRWIDGTDIVTWTCPLWWTLGDFALPFAVRWEYLPSDLYVVLYKAGEAPVTASDPISTEESR